MFYGVLLVDFGQVRGHLGQARQGSDGAILLGIDGTVGNRLVLRADWRELADGDEAVTSLGFLCPLSSRWVAEGWVSFPTGDADNGWVVKANYVIPLRSG